MTGRPFNVGLSLAPADGTIKEVHFTLLQLRLFMALGLDSGIMRSAFAMPLNFMTKEELDEKLRKQLERMWQALLGRSFDMGIKISNFMDVIDKKIGEIRKEKARLMAKDETPEVLDAIAQLDHDEKHFKEFKKELNEIDDDRRAMNSETQADEVESDLKSFKSRFGDFIDRMRARNKRKAFEYEADGLDETSAHSNKRKKKPTPSSSGPNVYDMPPPADADADLDEDDAFDYYDDDDEPQASARGAKPKPDVA